MRRVSVGILYKQACCEPYQRARCRLNTPVCRIFILHKSWTRINHMLFKISLDQFSLLDSIIISTSTENIVYRENKTLKVLADTLRRLYKIKEVVDWVFYSHPSLFLWRFYWAHPNYRLCIIYTNMCAYQPHLRFGLNCAPLLAQLPTRRHLRVSSIPSLKLVSFWFPCCMLRCLAKQETECLVAFPLTLRPALSRRARTRWVMLFKACINQWLWFQSVMSLRNSKLSLFFLDLQCYHLKNFCITLFCPFKF
jgi:hypothetical protein